MIPLNSLSTRTLLKITLPSYRRLYGEHSPQVERLIALLQHRNVFIMMPLAQPRMAEKGGGRSSVG